MYPIYVYDVSVVYATYIGVAGLSLVSFFGAFKFVSLWKHVQRFRIDNRIMAGEISTLRLSLITRQAEVREKEELIASIRKEVDRATKQVANLQKDLEGFRRQNTSLSERSRSLETEVQRLKRDLEHARKEKAETVELLGSRTTEVQRLKRDLEHVKKEKAETVDLLVSRTAEVQRLKRELEYVRKENAETVELLDTRTAELKGAQTFLTKADNLAGADVIDMLESLNSEIMQLAAFMAESFEFPERGEGEVQGEEMVAQWQDAQAQAAEVFGVKMVDLLKTSQHHGDPILVQIAFQAGLCAYTHWMISSWFFEDTDDEGILSEIYARVREIEEQAVSGRWRALTRLHVQRMTAQEPDLAVYIVDVIVNILIVAGLRETHASLHDQVTNRFSERINVILKAAKLLNKAIGEGVTSCDLEALYIAPDVTYDPTTMEDMFGGSANTTPTETPEKVVCTTDLGLVRAEKIAGVRGEWQESVLLKPKVVLPSGIQDVVQF